MEEGEKERLKSLQLKEVNYEAYKEEIEEDVKRIIGIHNLRRIKKGIHLHYPFYYPFFKENLREAAYHVADSLKRYGLLDAQLKEKRLEKDDVNAAYHLYTLHILEE